ncbi:hypothetical protein AALB39_27410 [Lachnospiraceae bacterium 54-53]
MMLEQNEMETIITPMVEHVCDHLCRFPREISDQEEIDRICGGCEMGQHLCNILNAYNAATLLQAAAEVVRNELLQKGDWYNALVVSIHNYLLEAGCIASWEQMARELADQIVGIEQEQEV